jgi:A/G-specific adenine glycosylase
MFTHPPGPKPLNYPNLSAAGQCGRTRAATFLLSAGSAARDTISPCPGRHRVCSPMKRTKPTRLRHNLPGERRALTVSSSSNTHKSEKSLRRALLAWYVENRRDLPWRKNADPYRIWLSEIMLQQTRVSAVLDYYLRFLDRFPNLEALAAAPEDAVLAAWSGLGYYRRARMLHRCAQEIAGNGGQFPNTAKTLQLLPGIGRYTAAAVASIAFGEPVAVVDGNVERVIQRLAGRILTKQETWHRAGVLLDSSRPGDFNQAMMELGATVCLPREPRCPECPVREWCAAHGEIPQSKVASRQHRKEIWCSLSRRDGHVRLVRRPSNTSLMPGMWELPHWPRRPRFADAAACWRRFRHSITVTDYNVYVLRNWALKGKLGSSATPAKRGQWVSIGDLPSLPITGLTRKILKADGII